MCDCDTPDNTNDNSSNNSCDTCKQSNCNGKCTDICNKVCGTPSCDEKQICTIKKGSKKVNTNNNHIPSHCNTNHTQCNTNYIPCPPVPNPFIGCKITKQDCGDHTFKSNFQSMVTPVSNLRSGYSRTTGNLGVDFKTRRKNKTIVFQWEPFEGNVGATGVEYLTVTQPLAYVPPYSMYSPIMIRYRDETIVTMASINRESRNIRFYLTLAGQGGGDEGNGVLVNDFFHVYGGSMVWVLE